MGKAKKARLKATRSYTPYGSHTAKGQKTPNKNTSKGNLNPKTRSPGQLSQGELKLPFEATDRILLVGEGDFSFSLSLSSHHGCEALTATTFDTREALIEKHPQAAAHIEDLISYGHEVFYQIDATRLGQRHAAGAAALRKARFDAIIFNFPHVGGRSTDVNRQVRANQDLVVRFLETGKRLLAPSGRILVTVFEGQPYELWGLRNLARHVGLQVERSMRFEAALYPGYKHARTLGNIEGGRGWKGEERLARTYIFQGSEIPNESKETEGPYTSKNNDGSDGDD